MEPLLFWLFALGTLGSGLVVVLHRHPVSAALGLVGTSLCLAGLFGMLGATFLAIVQVLVYAGAVMVLFLFIIMMLDLQIVPKRARSPWALGLALAVGAGVLLLLLQVTAKLPAVPLSPRNVKAELFYAQRLGLALYSEHVVALMLVGLLLLVGMVGVLLLSRKPETPTNP